MSLAVSTAQASPGDHVRVGDATVTPSVQSGFEYHSNAYLLEGGDGAPPVAASDWTLTPRLAADLDNRNLELHFGLGWALKKFVDFDTEDAYNVQNLDHFKDFDANLGVYALNKNVLGLRLDDKFEISNTPAKVQTAEEGISANYTHLSNDLNAGIAIRPGSALEIALLGNAGVDRYDVPEPLVEDGDPNINNRSNYGPVLDVKWRFLPKTSLLFTGSANWLRWDHNLVYAIGPDVEGVNYGQYIGKPDALAWRFATGIRGQFTDKIAAEAQLGYGRMTYDEDSVLEDPNAQSLPSTSTEIAQTGAETFARDLTSFGEGFTVNTQVAWSPVRGHTVTAGYKKDFQDAFFTNYVVYNYLFVRYEGLFASRVGLTGEITYRLDAFHGEVARKDNNTRMKVTGAYRFNDFLAANLAAGWVQRACGDENCGPGGIFYSTQYDDFTVSAGATFTY